MKEIKKITTNQKTIVGGIIGAAIVGGIIGACGCKAFMDNKYVTLKKNMKFYRWEI